MIELFCKIAEVDRGVVCSRGRNSMIRSMLMEFLYRHYNISQLEIGRLTEGGLIIGQSSVSDARTRLRQRMEKDTTLKQRFEAIDINLSRLNI